MIAPFALFRTESDGSVKWLDVCADIDAAKARVAEIAANVPGEYFIFSQTTGNKLFIKHGRANKSGPVERKE